MHHVDACAPAKLVVCVCLRHAGDSKFNQNIADMIFTTEFIAKGHFCCSSLGLPFFQFIGVYAQRFVIGVPVMVHLGGQDQICPNFRQGRGLGGGCAPSPENFSIFELKKVSFGASLVLFFAVD